MGTIKYVRKTLNLICLSLILILLAYDNVYGEITRGPYLQPTEDLQTSVGIAWRTANHAQCTLYYGIQDENENSVSVGPDTIHYVLLEGLTEGTVYKYKVSGDGETTPVYEFKTSPADGNFKLLVGADWHFGAGSSARERFLNIYPDMLAFDPDVALLVGDIAQTDGLTDLSVPYNEMFTTCRELFATAIVVHVPGNHESAADGNLDFFVEQYYFPENGPSGREERTYSLTYGKSRFVVFNYIHGEDQNIETWLDADLDQAKQAGAEFLFAGRHFPTYLDSSRDRELTLGGAKTMLARTYDKNGLDIEFMAHRHGHQRTYPIINNSFDTSQWGIIVTNDKGDRATDQPYGANVEGTIYHQIRSTYYQFTNCYNGIYFASAGSTGSYIGYTELIIADGVCAVESYRYDAGGSNRELEDRYVIDKTDTSEPPAPLVSNVSVAELGAHRALITFDTDMDCRGQIEFGTVSGDYPYLDMRDEQNQVFKKSHSLILPCLTPNTTYYYRARAYRAGKFGYSAEESFTTPAQAAAGERVAEFDFGPIVFAPVGTRISQMTAPYTGGPSEKADPTTRQSVNYAGYPYYFGAYNYSATPTATDTFLFYWNNYPTPTWRTELPNGEYDIEITVGKAHWFFGDVKIVLEDGQVVIEALHPEDGSTVWTWPTRVTINDGYLDVTLGYNDDNYFRFTPLNQIKVWAKGHHDPDVEPPVPEAGPDQTVDVETEVSFDGSGSTDNVGIVYYHWDFDSSDGIQIDGNGPTPKHAYREVGTYTVTLTVDDAVGNGPVSDTLTVTVNADSTAPVTQAMPRGRTFSTPVTVSLLSDEAAMIYYSTDGNDPAVGASNTTAGPSPLGGIALDATTALKFFATDLIGNKEDVKTEDFTILASPLNTYYIDPAAASGGNGSFENPFQTIGEGLNVAQAGDSVILKDGTYSYTSEVNTVRGGNAVDGPITIKALNEHGAILTRKGKILNISHPYITVEGIVLDHQFSRSGRVMWVRTGADSFHFKNCIARNSSVHIINLVNSGGDYLEDVAIEGCLIHGGLNFSIDAGDNLLRNDAHGISTEGVKDLVVTNTEIYDVSGDCMQPEYENWDNILLSNVHFWSRAIPNDVAQALSNAHDDQRYMQLEGKYPGENAIDTKSYESNVRGRITLADSVFNGWHSDFISTCAALNLKQNITAVVVRCLFYGNEYPFRLRGKGSKPSAHVTIKNCVVYDNDISVRAEDKIDHLHIYNNTFGPSNIRAFQQAPSSRGIGEDFQAYNNLFIGDDVPAEMSDASNVKLDETNVVDAANRDYHLVSTSAAIDAGVEILQVVTDKDKIARPQGAAYDIGAYEYPGQPGDVDGDGDVDIFDLFAVASAFGTVEGDAGYNPACDFDSDGDVDISDLYTCGSNFGVGV